MAPLPRSDRLPIARVLAELNRGRAMSLHLTARELSEESVALRAQADLTAARSRRLRESGAHQRSIA